MLRARSEGGAATGASRRAAAGDDATVDRLQEVFRTSGVAMGLVGLDGTWLAVTDRLCGLLGTDPEGLLAVTPRDLIHPDDRPAAVRATRALLAGGVASVDTHRRYLRADGGVLRARVATTLLRDPDGRPDSFLTQLLEEDAAPPTAEEHQAAAGLAGPDTLLAHLGRALGRSRRAGRTVVLVHVDLPRAPAAGHDAGLRPRLLTCAAQRLLGAVRAGDLVAAWPGGRLTVCCEGLHDDTDVPRVLARLHGTLDAPVEVDGRRHRLQPAVSAAVAGRTEAAEELLAREGWPVTGDAAGASPAAPVVARPRGRHSAGTVV